ncbi:hypothetical protein HK101_008051 [Irineochytrium annulatum]|nr:hypothetical protein HK101_008051 [Irineochytrium annulatum]
MILQFLTSLHTTLPKKGYLEHHARVHGDLKWTPRYAVVAGMGKDGAPPTVYLFKNSEGNAAAVHTIVLEASTVIAKGKLNDMILFSKQGDFVLRAQDEADMNSWIITIRHIIRGLADIPFQCPQSAAPHCLQNQPRSILRSPPTYTQQRRPSDAGSSADEDEYRPPSNFPMERRPSALAERTAVLRRPSHLVVPEATQPRVRAATIGTSISDSSLATMVPQQQQHFHSHHQHHQQPQHQQHHHCHASIPFPSENRSRRPSAESGHLEFIASSSSVYRQQDANAKTVYKSPSVPLMKVNLDAAGPARRPSQPVLTIDTTHQPPPVLQHSPYRPAQEFVDSPQNYFHQQQWKRQPVPPPRLQASASQQQLRRTPSQAAWSAPASASPFSPVAATANSVMDFAWTPHSAPAEIPATDVAHLARSLSRVAALAPVGAGDSRDNSSDDVSHVMAAHHQTTQQLGVGDQPLYSERSSSKAAWTIMYGPGGVAERAAMEEHAAAAVAAAAGGAVYIADAPVKVEKTDEGSEKWWKSVTRSLKRSKSSKKMATIVKKGWLETVDGDDHSTRADHHLSWQPFYAVLTVPLEPLGVPTLCLYPNSDPCPPSISVHLDACTVVASGWRDDLLVCGGGGVIVLRADGPQVRDEWVERIRAVVPTRRKAPPSSAPPARTASIPMQRAHSTYTSNSTLPRDDPARAHHARPPMPAGGLQTTATEVEVEVEDEPRPLPPPGPRLDTRHKMRRSSSASTLPSLSSRPSPGAWSDATTLHDRTMTPSPAFGSTERGFKGKASTSLERGFKGTHMVGVVEEERGRRCGLDGERPGMIEVPRRSASWWRNLKEKSLG